MSENGKVTAKRKGRATVTATVKGTAIKAQCKITVGIPVNKVTLNRKWKLLTLKTGQSFAMKTSVSPQNASVRQVNYKSSNPKVASVNKKGVIQALSAGTVKISAAAADGSGKKAVCMVKVEKPETAGETEKPEETEKPGEAEKPESGRLLVAYFSWSGTSERIAKSIIEQTGADSFRIERETPYSDDYNTVVYGEAKDEADQNARPPIKEPLASVAQYDRIVLCYLIWLAYHNLIQCTQG